MDKLKNLLKSDTPVDDPGQSRTVGSGRLSGQGTHFPGKDETSTGTTVTGTDPQTRGPTDVSAAPADSTAAARTTGPEQGGTGHIGTTSAASAQPSTQTTEPVAVKPSATQEATGGIKDYSVASADFPKTESSADGSGTAAVAQTSTYSSSPLPRGDPTSSVADPSSADPLTYKKPESGAEGGAATTAASLAFAQGEERRKADMAGHENPYRAAALDPRVDGMSRSSAEAVTADAPAATTSTTGGAGSGLASAGAATAFGSGQHPSLTSTTDPASKVPEYESTAADKGLGSADTAASSNQGVVGKALGAVGLGGIASAIGYGATSGDDTSAVAETPEQPTTTTGLSSYTAPTEQGAPTSHHRKESIPTTAYPSGTFASPRAVNQPIGGAGSPVTHGDRDSHVGRDVATGTAAGVGVAGATAVGAHEYDKSKSLREGISGEPQGTAPLQGTTAISGVDQSRYDDGQKLREGIVSQQSTAHHATTIGGATSATTDPGVSRIENITQQPSAAGATRAAPVTTAGPGGTDPGVSRIERAVEQPSTAGTAGTAAGGAALATAAADPGVSRLEKTTAQPTLGGASAAPPATAVAPGGTEPAVARVERAVEQPPTAATATKPEEKDHTTRDTVIGAGAGTAAIGAGAYGAHEYSKREAEKAETEAAKQQAAREKEAARERAAHEKELEKQHKADEKAAAKEEKAHQKDLEKEEKKHQKELEKEEKKHEKEEQKRMDSVAKHQAEADEEAAKREKRQNWAEGQGYDQAATVAAAEEEKEKREKKPSIFKRIFKKRQNKDTGEEEEYSSEEEEHPHGNKAASAAYGGAVVGAGASALEEGERKSSHPASGTTAGATGPSEAITGLPYDASKDQGAARRLSEHTRGQGIGEFDNRDARAAAVEPESTTGAAAVTSGAHDKSAAPSTLESTGTRSMQPTEAVTGTTAATTTGKQSTAPGTTESTGVHSQQPSGAVTGVPVDTSKEATTHDTGSNLPVNTNFTLGEVQESTGGLGDKIKEALHIGSSHKKEEE